MSPKSGKQGSVRHAASKVQNKVGGAVARASAGMVTDANEFVKKAAVSDLYELRAAEIALRRSSSAEIESIARRMIQDHTTSTHQLQAALEMNETRGVAAPPHEPDERRKKMLQHLDAAPDGSFDETYLAQQVAAHEEALTLMTQYRDEGDNPQLRSLAAATAPVIQRHLERMQALQDAN